MRRTLRGMMLAVLLIAAAPFCGAWGRMKRQDGPALLGCELYQLGASEAVLNLSGRELPEPELSFDGNHVRIVLRDCRSAVRDEADYAAAVPLISEMTIRQASGDTVIDMGASSPLQLRFSHGAAPASRYTFRFITTGEAGRLQRSANLTPAAGHTDEPAPSPPAAAKGETITLDLRDADLHDVFRMLGACLQKNVILDPSLPSVRVTLMLQDVPVEEALGYLMKAYGIRQQPMGKDTVILGTRDGLARLSGEEETRAFRIAYADPAAVPGLLASLTRLPAERFALDPRLKILYITSNPTKLEEAAAFLQALDRPGRQVMLQAKIFELTDGSERDVEAALNTVYDHWWFSYSAQGGGRGGYIGDNRQGRSFSGPPSGYPLPGMTNLETPLEGVWREFDIAFRALESRGKGRTLASPSVIALDGQGAKISLTEDYPYISGRDEAGNPTWSTETVGPQLTLTPHVGRDGLISLQIEIVTGEVLEMITGSTGEQMPRTSTRSISTSVRVRDGEPFVMGGLFRDNQTHRRVRMPIVGEIPLLGSLFTYHYDERNRTQAIIVVVPHILDTPDAPVEGKRIMRY